MKTTTIATTALGVLLAVGFMFPTTTARADLNIDEIYVSFDCIATVGSCNNGHCVATVGDCDGGSCWVHVGDCSGNCIGSVGSCAGSCIAYVGSCGEGASCVGSAGTCDVDCASLTAEGRRSPLVDAACKLLAGGANTPALSFGDGYGATLLP